MIDTQQINDILGIKEAYQLHDALESILFDKSKRENTFKAFLNVESDLSYDWFTNYFQEEQSNRKSMMQDYTPDCNGVIQTDKVEPKYLYYILDMVIPDFLRRYQTGLNINPSIFKHLKFSIHDDRSIQKMIISILDSMQFGIEREKRQIEEWNKFKQYHLDGMMI